MSQGIKTLGLIFVTSLIFTLKISSLTYTFALPSLLEDFNKIEKP